MIDNKLVVEYRYLFYASLGHDYCHGQELVYTDDKNDKEYYTKHLSDDKINELMKKSIQDKHNYLFEAVKDNPCPPYEYKEGVLY